MAEPKFRQEGTQLPKGSATQLNEAASEAAMPAPETPSGPDLGLAGSPEPEAQADFDDGLDFEEGSDFDESDEEELPTPTGDAALMFGPTRFPDRPLTTGIPGSPGPDDLPLPNEGPRAYLRRVAQRLADSPTAPDSLKSWAERVATGQ